MIFKLIPTIIITLFLGVGLGYIPVINQHLHWNFWFIIPVSGLIFGLVIGVPPVSG